MLREKSSLARPSALILAGVLVFLVATITAGNAAQDSGVDPDDVAPILTRTLEPGDGLGATGSMLDTILLDLDEARLARVANGEQYFVGAGTDDQVCLVRQTEGSGPNFYNCSSAEVVQDRGMFAVTGRTVDDLRLVALFAPDVTRVRLDQQELDIMDQIVDAGIGQGSWPDELIVDKSDGTSARVDLSTARPPS